MGGKNSGIQMVHTESIDLFQNHDFNFRNSPHQLQDSSKFVEKWQHLTRNVVALTEIVAPTPRAKQRRLKYG